MTPELETTTETSGNIHASTNNNPSFTFASKEEISSLSFRVSNPETKEAVVPTEDKINSFLADLNERVNLLEDAHAKLTQAILSNPGFFPSAVVESVDEETNE